MSLYILTVLSLDQLQPFVVKNLNIQNNDVQPYIFTNLNITQLSSFHRHRKHVSISTTTVHARLCDTEVSQRKRHRSQLQFSYDTTILVTFQSNLQQKSIQ